MSRAARRHHAQRIARRRRPLDRAGMSDNELATRHPLDCQPRCWLCHAGKLSGVRPPREQAQRTQMDRDIEEAA